MGVVATQDPAAMLAGDADAVVYAAAANLRPLDAVEDMVSILRAGKNVVSCSVVPLVFPDAVDAAFTEPLRQAAIDGGVSFFTTGIDSGFANDVLPLMLTGVSRMIESVRVTEMFNYATYPDRSAVYEILGFGQQPDYPAFAAQPGIFTFGWGPVLHQLAAGLGVKIDNIEEANERIPAGESFDTPTGHIAAGTIAAMRSTLTGYVGGKPTFVLDHVTRMRDDVAPDWPSPASASSRRTSVTARRPAAGCTASRSRVPRACAANSRWPKTTTTTWGRASRAPRGWSTPSPPCAPPRPGCSPRWTCRSSPGTAWCVRCRARRPTAGCSSW
ncbi:putative dihydrodipicolinate reductase, domain protein [Mycobacterium intracellulare 1956]|uniref:Putative dihydrodipicolinate reductase, domain protein n=1 Tax=Mycobacterium intracellulare 1956 TaxID=1299331 RepID=X8CEV8_MYCIT|nr:putative dihydrodipicolinate reductase, domain protein [Mycobacterium intracellulare 1956]